MELYSCRYHFVMMDAKQFTSTPCEAEMGQSISTSEVINANVKSAKIESLSTVAGSLHANMEVMFRWDPASELTTEPPIIVSFNTLFGYFSTLPAKKSGDYWVVVNQAADKSKPGETVSAICVDMSLDYTLFDQELNDAVAGIN